LLGKDAPNLSPGSIGRLTAEWQVEYEAWQKRDLSARRYAYAWADGVYLQARMEENAECMLVLIGATPEGKKELVGFQTGVREGAQSWRELLMDIKRRGLEIAPHLAVGDGALGFWNQSRKSQRYRLGRKNLFRLSGSYSRGAGASPPSSIRTFKNVAAAAGRREHDLTRSSPAMRSALII
jgi:hypothetical protein